METEQLCDGFSIFSLLSPPPADCGAVHAADGGIVSSDIVGYATGSLTKGNYNTMTVQFNSIGKSGFSLNDITLTGMTAGDGGRGFRLGRLRSVLESYDERL